MTVETAAAAPPDPGAVAREPDAAAAEADPTAGYSFSVVPHTHWDREWYLPFESFRMRLARTVDTILDTLEADDRFAHFTLDGQAVILEDYLELRPGQADRLRRVVAGGRFSVGPAYVLPDEFLAGPESLVRNLLVGRAVCERLGVEAMPVGYMPDPFGHVAQLPQILRGFGLTAFIFWRGLGDEADRVGLAFDWRAPDGSSVTAVRQLGSYGSANELGRWERDGVSVHHEPWRWPATAAYRFVRFIERYRDEIERTGSRELLLCNGADHEGIQADLPDLLEAARAAHPDAEIRISSYPAYVARLTPGLRDLPVLEGELVGGRDAPVLRGINSARMYLKQAHEAAERALLVAETLASLATLRDGAPAYPGAELERAWKQLLQNLPHDSISGCSVDEVHADMGQRFRTVERIAERVRREALSALAGTAEPWSYRPRVTASRSVLNPRARPRLGLAAVPLPPELERARGLRVRWLDGSVDRAQRGGQEGVPVALVTRALGGFAGATLTLERGTAPAPPDAARAVDERTIENDRYRVELRDDGTLGVTDRRSGQRHAALHVLEDVADAGDEYNFGALPGDRPWTTRGARGRVRVTADGPVVAEVEWTASLRLPAGLDRRRTARSRRTVRCPVTVRVRLVRGVERVELRTTVLNAARDHRLRVRFRAPGATVEAPVRVEGHFTVLRRPARPPATSGWVETPAGSHHTLGAVAAGDLAVFGRGLPEYEAVPAGDGALDVALTLLRCVGWLSRDDVQERSGHAGPEIAVSDAQCLGEHAFEYAIAFGAGSWSEVELLAASEDFRYPLEVGPPGVDAHDLLGFDERLAFSALKGAADGEGVILRVFNPGAEPVDAALRTSAARTERVRLDESAGAEGRRGDSDGAGDPVAPGEIRSIRIAPG